LVERVWEGERLQTQILPKAMLRISEAISDSEEWISSGKFRAWCRCGCALGRRRGWREEGGWKIDMGDEEWK